MFTKSSTKRNCIIGVLNISPKLAYESKYCCWLLNKKRRKHSVSQTEWRFRIYSRINRNKLFHFSLLLQIFNTYSHLNILRKWVTIHSNITPENQLSILLLEMNVMQKILKSFRSFHFISDLSWKCHNVKLSVV